MDPFQKYRIRDVVVYTVLAVIILAFLAGQISLVVSQLTGGYQDAPLAAENISGAFSAGVYETIITPVGRFLMENAGKVIALAPALLSVQ